MAGSQLEVDVGEARSDVRQPPDDNRKPGRLRSTSERERQHRDRGVMRDSDVLRAIKENNRD